MKTTLKSPYPWPGGKSKVAETVWRAFGDCPNYVEPFFGSGAVLLGRPHVPHIETVNDINVHIANFWRSIQADPEAVAAHADWPVNEIDLHARHRWLVEGGGSAEFREALREDPHHYDVKRAGWWVWGLCQWIGTGWCADDGKARQQLPFMGASGTQTGMGVHGAANLRMPALGHSGRGVHSPEKRHLSTQLPSLSAGGDLGSGRGVNSKAAERAGLIAWFGALSDRLRKVRVACGDWSRICTGAVTGASNTKQNMGMGPCAVFLDPPYKGHGEVYADGADVSDAVREWAIANGENKSLRIALCGYEGEHNMPASWTCHAWKAQGGYANRNGGDANENARRERIWFSPHCLPLEERQPSLFGVGS